MNRTRLEQAVERVRREADVVHACGAQGNAEAMLHCADVFEDALCEWWLEELTTGEAAQELGVGDSAVQKRVRAGTLKSVAEKGSPRYRRCDLYERGPHAVEYLRTEDGQPDVAGELLREIA